MLHILWTIIKVVLIILAVILGLVLALILLLLFCPIQYYAGAQKEPDTPLKEFSGMAKAAWLWHGITLRMDYTNGNISIVLRLFGIPISKLLKKIFNKTKKTTEKVNNKSAEINNDEIKSEQTKTTETEKSKSDSVETISIEQAVNNNVETDNALNDRAEDIYFENAIHENNFVVNETEEDVTASSQQSKDKKTFISKILQIIKKIIGFPFSIVKKIAAFVRKIRDKLHELHQTISRIRKKTDWYKRFLTHPKTKAALALVWEDGKKLIHHILPKKIRGNMKFDNEDPYITGLILAGVGMTIPMHKNKIKITPLFEQRNYFEGKLKLSGRIYGIVIVKTAIEIYFNRNVKFVMRKMRHKEAA
ncbi:MAG: DUF2953 domain-containing protein [Eubacteriales bacterium]|nr:DUF2953 domain-containing protein [Eubacteriales bacterium]